MIKIFAFIAWVIALIGWAIFGIDTFIKYKKDEDYLDSFLIMQFMYIALVFANLIMKIV